MFEFVIWIGDIYFDVYFCNILESKAAELCLILAYHTT